MQTSSKAFLLHARKFTDSRVILEVFSEQHGKFSGIYRIGKSRRGSSTPQQFTEYLITWFGKNELKTISSVEALEFHSLPSGPNTFSGLYINELIQKLLPHSDNCENLYGHYQQCLRHLNSDFPLEFSLRLFEFYLFDELGIQTDYTFDDKNAVIQKAAHYRFLPAHGWIKVEEGTMLKGALSGETIHGIKKIFETLDLNLLSTLSPSLKHLHRQIIDDLLAGKTLKSRELFS